MMIFLILTLVAVIGGIFTVFKVGSKDGICNYDYVDGENDVQDR